MTASKAAFALDTVQEYSQYRPGSERHIAVILVDMRDRSAVASEVYHDLHSCAKHE